MTEYRIKWQQCPHNYHDVRVLFIEAATPEDARTIARDYIERRYGIDWFNVYGAEEARTPPAGKVIEVKP